MVRALASHQSGLGSIPARCHKWVEFVVGSLLATRVFLQVLHFPPSTKNNSLNSSSTRIGDPHENQLELIFNKIGLNMFELT